MIRVTTETKKYDRLVEHKGHDAYFTHDNGGRPFFVIVSSMEFWVYRKPPNGNFVDDEQGENYTDLVCSYPYLEKHIGLDLDMDPRSVGNSCLFWICDTRCVYVGECCYSFEMAAGDSIRRYCSDVGNSDIPYPYLIGNKYVYFMLDKCLVPIDLVDADPDFHDLYRWFYGFEKNGGTTFGMSDIKMLAVRKW
jgi:hypothetical protein